jgi:hypothetical protein
LSRPTEVVLSVSKLRDVYDPFKLTEWLWGCAPFTQRLVHKELEWNAGVFASVPRHSRHDAGVFYHVSRIAWLVNNYPKDSIAIATLPIRTAPFLVENGNHRLAAAIVRKESTIKALISGDVGVMQPYMEEE